MITIFSSIIGAIIGATLGFFFSWKLFNLKERAKERSERISLANFLKRELEYNIELIDEWKKYITQDLKFLEWAKPIYNFSPRYDLFQNTFLIKAFKLGIIYDLLNNKQLKIIAEILTIFTIDRKRSIIDRITKYKDEDIVSIDDEGVPTTGKDYIEIMLEHELKMVKKIKEDLIKISPFIEIKNEETILEKVIKPIMYFIQKRFYQSN